MLLACIIQRFANHFSQIGRQIRLRVYIRELLEHFKRALRSKPSPRIQATGESAGNLRVDFIKFKYLCRPESISCSIGVVEFSQIILAEGKHQGINVVGIIRVIARITFHQVLYYVNNGAVVHRDRGRGLKRKPLINQLLPRGQILWGKRC